MKAVKRLIVFLILLCPLISYQQSWIKSDLPNIGRYDDVSFVNDSIGYISTSFEIYKSINYGKNWSKVSESPLLGFVRSIEFIDENIGFFGTLKNGNIKSGLFKTTDGCKTIYKVLELADEQGICGISHFNQSVIAVGTYAGNPTLHFSDDAGETFTKIHLDSLMDGAVDCHMVTEMKWYVSGQASNNLGLKPTIIVTENGGKTWKTSLLPSVNSKGFVWKMSFINDKFIAASTQSFNENSTFPFIYLSSNGGENWEEKNVGGSPNLGGILFFENGKGLVCDQYASLCYETSDYGNTWSVLSDIMSSVNRILLINNKYLVASGNGAYYYDGIVSSVNNKVGNNNEYLKLYVSPNPTNNILKITTDCSKSTFGVIELFNSNMQLIKKMPIKTFPIGISQEEINVSDIPNGKYFIVWKNSYEFKTTSFIKV